MTHQFLSEKMSRHLSSLAPGFEGHYDYYGTPRGEMIIVCRGEYLLCESLGRTYGKEICPAWQVEDVLREAKNIKALESVCIECERKGVANSEDNCDHCGMNYSGNFISNVYNLTYKISEEMASNPDTAYQKIEEYLWSILT